MLCFSEERNAVPCTPLRAARLSAEHVSSMSLCSCANIFPCQQRLLASLANHMDSVPSAMGVTTKCYGCRCHEMRKSYLPFEAPGCRLHPMEVHNDHADNVKPFRGKAD